MAFIVVYDACALHPAPLRDLLIRLASAGLVRARWSERILDECFRSILRSRPDLKPEALARTRELMNLAIPDAEIRGFETIEKSLALPDPDDRHVLAAAIRAGAQTIVTQNLSDFPAQALSPFDIEARHPDDFVLALIELAPAAVVRVIEAQVTSLRNPPMRRDQLFETFREIGLVQTVARLQILDAGV